VNSSRALIKTKSSPALKKAANVNVLNKKNVMNTIHNVTVASPPSSASKERSASTSDISQDVALLKPLNHARSRTRTIAPEDSILHKQNMVKEEKVEVVEPVKEPVAFEINFEEATAQKAKGEDEPDEYSYESDFESYESDFEPEVPSLSASSESLEREEPEVNDFVDNGIISNGLMNSNRIDSGSFEMSAKKSAVSLSAHYDSIDDTINSHDSGISYEDLNAANRRVLSPKVYEFYRRGKELMKKITFDELSFNIFESKPIPYEIFMNVYGQRNMFQVGTQSESLQTVDKVQTDPITKAEAWTQFPTKFTRNGLEGINSKLYNEEKLGVGEDSDSLSQNITAINNFSKTEEIIPNKSNAAFNSSELQRFVENAAIVIANVIDNQSKQQELSPSKISISRGFTHLKFNDISVLHDTTVKKIHTNLSVKSFVITVHKRKDSQQNFLCLWDVINTKRPMKIFISWSDLRCLEMHEHQRNVIVGGCSDGTICVWDTQECAEWKDESTKPCEIISLNQSTNDFALDNVVALKCLSYRKQNSSPKMFSQSQASQICSLHKSGTIIIWTISISRAEMEIDSAKKLNLEFIDFKSRVKLIKNLTIDLNSSPKTTEKETIKRKSAFEKTRYYFENDLFSDKVLRELQEIDTNRLSKTKNNYGDHELMKFNDCAVSLNEIFAASDMNYIVALSRLNLGDKTRKIFTNQSSFISPTAIKMHPMNNNVLAVGQTNGEVKFMKLYEDEDSSTNYSAKYSKKSNDASFVSDILSKSCAFQNIVEQDKKFYNDTQALNNLESDELKAFLVNEALSEQFYEQNMIRDNLNVSFDKNIFNSFEISPSSVNIIEFNETGEFMFILIGRQLKIFNCWANIEVEQQEKSNICDVKCVQGADFSEYLVNFK
jgi:hypothetical protein